MYEIAFHPRFKKDIKGLSADGIQVLHELLSQLKENPSLCNQLIGDLKGVYRCKLKIKRLDYRLAYLIEENVIKILMLRKREGFHKTLKQMIK